MIGFPPPINREAIMVALFDLLSAAFAWTTTGRRVRFWGDLAPAEAPAMFVRHIGDKYLTTSSLTQHRLTGLPPQVYVDAEAWIFAETAISPSAIPETLINQLVDTLEGALHPGPALNTQTLDGLVRHCWIDGDVTIDPGELDGKAVAVIPIRMLVPGRSSPGVAAP